MGDLAGDLRAAVDAVRRDPGVDPTGVSIWSLSQGGWIAPAGRGHGRETALPDSGQRSRGEPEREATWIPAPATLDPAAILRNVRAPVLAVHGADDVDVPASVNSPLFARLSAHRNSRQQVFPRADHYLLVGITDPDREYRHLSPGYLPLLVDWIHKQSVVPAR